MPSLSRLAALTCTALVVGAAPAFAADAHEPNDTRATAAGPLVDGRSYSGEIASEEDRDWFAFLAGAAGTVTVTAANDTPRGCFGPEFYVFDEAGAQVAKAHPASTRSESVTFTAPAAGRYFVRVTPYYIEPCAPADTKYRFNVRGGLVAALPGPSGGGGNATPAPAPAPTPSKPSAPSGGSGSSTSPAKQLLSPALRLGRSSLAGRTLRASGTVAAGARGGKVRVTLSRQVGRRTITAKTTVTVASGGRWSARVTLPATLRAATSVRVEVAYLADRSYRAATARKTVKRTAS